MKEYCVGISKNQIQFFINKNYEHCSYKTNSFYKTLKKRYHIALVVSEKILQQMTTGMSVNWTLGTSTFYCLEERPLGLFQSNFCVVDQCISHVRGNEFWLFYVNKLVCHRKLAGGVN